MIPPSASPHREPLRHRRRVASPRQAPTYTATTSQRRKASCRRRPRPRAPDFCPRLRPLLRRPLPLLSFLLLLPPLLLLSLPRLSLLFFLFLPPPLPPLPFLSSHPPRRHSRRHRRRARQPHRRRPPTRQGRQVRHISHPRMSAACSGCWTRRWTGGCPSRPKRTRPRTSRRPPLATRHARAESPSGARQCTQSRWTPHSSAGAPPNTGESCGPHETPSRRQRRRETSPCSLPKRTSPQAGGPEDAACPAAPPRQCSACQQPR